jgi:hypothetical protein
LLKLNSQEIGASKRKDMTKKNKNIAAWIGLNVIALGLIILLNI